MHQRGRNDGQVTDGPTTLRGTLTLELPMIKWDRPWLLLVVANAVGGFYMVASILGWWDSRR